VIKCLNLKIFVSRISIESNLQNEIKKCYSNDPSTPDATIVPRAEIIVKELK